MKLSKLFLIFWVTVVLSSCATPYQKVTGLTLTGGYYDERLPTGEYKVGFGGNGYTSSTTAIDYALLRCALITIEEGKTHFEIVQGGGQTQSKAIWTGYSVSYTSQPEAEYIIKLHDGVPTDTKNQVFNAEETRELVMQRNSLNDKYKVQKTKAPKDS